MTAMLFGLVAVAVAGIPAEAVNAARAGWARIVTVNKAGSAGPVLESVFHQVVRDGMGDNMAARMPDIANAVCDAADVFKVPLMGMIGTLHETIYPARGQTLVAEYYADLEYNDDGSLIVEGSCPLRMLNRKLGFDFPLDGPKTINGLLLEQLGEIPQPGQGQVRNNHHRP